MTPRSDVPDESQLSNNANAPSFDARTERKTTAPKKANDMKRLREQRRGVTLMELLVVATIILIVTAASVPTIKPMMESQLTKQAGSTVSTYLNRARARAMATQWTHRYKAAFGSSSQPLLIWHSSSHPYHHDK